MSSYDKQDVPTAAVFVENTEETFYSDIYFGERGFNTDNIHDLDYFRDSNTHHVVETVRRSDHQEKVEEARNEMRREILDKIEKIFEKYENGETPFDSYERAALRPFVKDLEEEVQDL